jgi:ABC-type nitrate/sulfonate/bicarbonate transport system ATPase subunit
MTAPALVIDGVTKTFETANGTVEALTPTNLTLEPARIATIVGPSGCGKSTLLRMIAGFDPPTSGRILLGDAVVSRPGADRGIVFQQPQLFPWLTVAENVVIGPKMRGALASHYEAEGQRYLAAVGLTGFERSYPYQLSGGMRQRLQIARVLINEPKILLMDEPFGALDYQTRLDMQKLLLDLAAKYHPTVLFITHDIDEAVFISDRIHVMSRRPGRIVETLDVPIERPRVYETVASSDLFIKLKLHALSLLRTPH